MRYLPIHAGLVFWAALATALLSGSQICSAATCVHPRGNVTKGPWGDVNGLGEVNAADALCTVLATLAVSTNPASPAYPGCLSGAVALADVNCDGAITVADTMSIVFLALGIPLPAATDADADGCPNACQACAPPGEHSCLISGVCVPGGAASPTDPCAACTEAADTAYTPLGDGAPCGGGLLCQGGACVAALPGAPTLLGISAGDGQLTATFAAPADDGGSTIIAYRLQCTGGAGSADATGVASPLTLAGLTNGVTYTCVVYAENANGEGPASGSAQGSPQASPAGGCSGIDCTGEETYPFAGSIETFIVPDGVYSLNILAEGASGGHSNNHPGGKGGFTSGTFAVTPGDKLYILAGQQGMYWGGVGNWHAGTGGGGSFVGLGASLATTTPLIVAGGGGGAAQNAPGENAGAVVTTTGNGAGGNDSPGQGWQGASGGAGFHLNGGHHGQHPTCVAGQPLLAQSFRNGGAGGYISNFGCGLPDNIRGGFGGGGCAGSSNGGGGGGYVGGNVNDLGLNLAGRAGTNYNVGTSAVHGTRAAAGHGRVVISWSANPPTLAVPGLPLTVAPITGGQSPGACTAFPVTNTSTSALSGVAIAPFAGTGAAHFELCTAVVNACSSTLPAGSTCNFGVRLVAAENGAFTADASVSANGGHLATRGLSGLASGFSVSGCTSGPGYPGPGSVTFQYEGIVKTFTVPAGVCELTIRAEGASGGPSNTFLGGKGGFAEGAFVVAPGSTLQIVAGQAGMYWGGVGNWHGGTGGGASTVALGPDLSTSTPLIVAGGGGGASQSGPGENAGNIVTASGTGAGGNDGVGQGWTGASGGAGFHANGGHHGNHPTCVAGQPLLAQSFINGSAGGYISNFGCGLPNTVRGGFGGGGCAGSAAGGGGGGFVGGNVNNLGINDAGRAGTNFNAGLGPQNGTRAATGNGFVQISW